MKLYLDSSALVRLIQREPESEPLRKYLRTHRGEDRVSSELARVEVIRSVLGGGQPAIAHARRQLARIYLVAIDRHLLDRAATLAPSALVRSLDAIHLATAELIGTELRAVVTYDQRMVLVAGSLGLAVGSPR